MIPPEVGLEEYSKKLHEEQPFSLVEDDIPFVLDIENRLSFKAIPRTVRNPGFFSHPNGINYGLDCMLLDPTYDTVNSVLSGMLKPNYALYKKNIKYNEDDFEFSTVSWQKIKLPQGKENWLLAHNDLLVEEYDHFRTSYLSWKRKSFQDNFVSFIKELNEIRNKIDCEQKIRNSLINRYGRIFYFKTIRLEEARAEFIVTMEIDDAGGIEAYVLGDDAADSSDAVPVSTDKMTPKEAVIQCCRKTAQQLLEDGTCTSIAAVLRTTNEFEACFKGSEKHKVTKRQLRQWLNGLNYDPSPGRPPGT